MPLYRNPRSPDVWWCRFWIRGREFRRSTGEANRRAALAAERRIRAEAEQRAPDRPEPGAVSIALLAGLDLQRAEAERVSDYQKHALCYLWDRLRAGLGNDRDARTLSATTLREYVANRRAEVTRQTIRREIQALRRALTLAEQHHLLKTQPIRPVDWPVLRSDPQSDKQAGKYHPPAVLRAWLDALDDDGRDLASFVLLTGLRRLEAERLVAGWVEQAPPGAELPAGVVAVLRIPASSTKGRKARTVALTAEALAIIKRRTRGDAPVFGSTLHRTTFEGARRRIGYAKSITLRDLRHTHATLGVRASLAGTRDALGHGKLSVTDRYVSAPLEQVAAVAAAVSLAMAGTPEPAHHERDSKIVSGRTGLRSQDLLRVNPEPGLHEHLSGCRYCQSIVRAHDARHAVAGRDRHTGPDYLAPLPSRGAK